MVELCVQKTDVAQLPQQQSLSPAAWTQAAVGILDKPQSFAVCEPIYRMISRFLKGVKLGSGKRGSPGEPLWNC